MKIIKEEKNLSAGIIGLGMIGGGIAESLVKSGRIPQVYDIRPDAAAGLDGVPMGLSSPAEVAGASDVVMVCVVNAEQANEVICGNKGLLQGAREGMAICLISTVSLQVVKELAGAAAEKGVSFIDCGVTPGNLAAQHGMVAMVGGDDDAVQYALPVLNDWAKTVVHCGPAGAGMATKIARNAITFGGWRIVKEAQHLVEAAGVDSQKLVEVIEAADAGGKTLLSKLRQNDSEGKVPKISAEKTLPLMIKDLKAAHDLAAALSVDMPAIDAAREKAYDTLDMEMPVPSTDTEHEESRTRGTQMADLVYGNGLGTRMANHNSDSLYNNFTLDHLFADVWSRPDLSIKDRRLLVMGVTAALGRADLIKIQARGALENKELTPEQLNEMVLQLAYYAGWCNAGSVAQGVSEAIHDFEAQDV